MTRSDRIIPRVLLLGARGQLGSAIAQAFSDVDLVAHTRTTLDITDGAAVARAIRDASPGVVINCVAFNDVDGAESAPLAALAVNAFAVRTLARASAEAGAVLVHYSTDFVFDGQASSPYDETSPPAPRSIYSASKLLGEWFALEAGKAYVLRVESLFGTPRGWTGRRGTLEAIVAGLEAGRDVRVFTDRIVTPSYIEDVARATRHLLASDAPYGLYHCVNDGSATWYEVAREAAALLGVEPSLVPVTTDQVTLKAARPRYCALSVEKLRAAGFSMPPWQEAIRRWIAARSAPAA